MTKYYYTDPLAAIWMARNFSMKFTGELFEGEISYYDLIADIFESSYNIHPDSFYLLEPQVGDIVRGIDDEVGTTIHLFGFQSASWKLERIMERDGIAFIWPQKTEG